MRRLSLNGKWQLTYFPAENRTINNPKDLSGLPTIQAQVPGNVELDLIAAGLIPDPFRGDNVKLLRPLERYEWWYRKSFQIPASWKGKEFELVFFGIDTLAEIWLNGELIGKAENMFIEHRFRVQLRYGEINELAVRIRSVVLKAEAKQYQPLQLSWEGREEALWIRKAAHMYGWDICPRIVSAGLWRDVELMEIEPNSIAKLYFWPLEVNEEKAKLKIWYQLRTDRSVDELNLRFTGRCGKKSFHAEFPLDFIVGSKEVLISDPELWWPRGYGEPALYDVECEICQGEEVLATRKEKLGIRTIELKRDENQFLFVVNGCPVMVKGTNWVPLDAFHSRDQERLKKAFDMLVDLGCNMVRCWVGGVYEPDQFFDLCDQHGVLVWQDFAFACARYPQADTFVENVKQEAYSVVERLRNHPSLALWCGNNENDMVHAGEGLGPNCDLISRHVLPAVVREADPSRVYIPSSPFVDFKPAPGEDWEKNLLEQHLWGPRSYYKGSYYTQQQARFIGEIGYHGCPAKSSLSKFLPPEKLWPQNAAWDAHATDHWLRRRRDYDRNQLMLDQVEMLFGRVPEKLEEFILASQVVQAGTEIFCGTSSLQKICLQWHSLVESFGLLAAILRCDCGLLLSEETGLLLFAAQSGACLLFDRGARRLESSCRGSKRHKTTSRRYI